MTEADIERLLDLADEGRISVLESARDAGIRLDAEVAQWSLNGDWPVVEYTLTFTVPDSVQTPGIVVCWIEDLMTKWRGEMRGKEQP